MNKPLIYRKPSGEWGIEGVDLSTLPPPVYGALAKLMRLEHPLCGTRVEMLRLASVEEMADMLARSCPVRKGCGNFDTCDLCWLDWLHEPVSKPREKPVTQRR